MQIDWEKIEKIKKEAINNQIFYLIQVINYQKQVMADTEKEMKELVSVSPSLVKYAREITDELKKVIEGSSIPVKSEWN